MKKILALILAMCMVFALCACGAEDTTGSVDTNAAAEGSAAENTEPTEAEASAESTNPETATTSTVLMSDIPGAPEGDLGNCHIKLVGCDYCGDDNGNTAIIITFEFTNNNAEAVVPMEVITCQAFQDGMSIGMAPITSSNLYDNGAALNNAVEPGATAVCQCAFTQASDAPIEFDVTEIAAVDGAKVYGSFDAAV